MVWFSLRVREVPGSIPGSPLRDHFLFRCSSSILGVYVCVALRPVLSFRVSWRDLRVQNEVALMLFALCYVFQAVKRSRGVHHFGKVVLNNKWPSILTWLHVPYTLPRRQVRSSKMSMNGMILANEDSLRLLKVKYQMFLRGYEVIMPRESGLKVLATKMNADQGLRQE